jgi:hypothetical protein
MSQTSPREQSPADQAPASQSAVQTSAPGVPEHDARSREERVTGHRKHFADMPLLEKPETYEEAHGHSGRPISWVMVAVILAGFVIGGVGLMLASLWMFCLGAALVVVGGVVAWRTGIMEDYTTSPLSVTQPRR